MTGLRLDCFDRCEHVLGNGASEVQCLLEAARMFIQAQKQSSDLLCPSYDENLTAAINCYEHAIKVRDKLILLVPYPKNSVDETPVID